MFYGFKNISIKYFLYILLKYIFCYNFFSQYTMNKMYLF